MPLQHPYLTQSWVQRVPVAVVGDSRDQVTDYIRTKEFKPDTMLARRQLVNGIGTEMALYKKLKQVPRDKVRNFQKRGTLRSD